MRESPLNSSKKSAKRIAQPYTDSLNAGRYNRPVAGLAILVQPISADQAEGIYCWEGYGSRVLYEYPVFKIYEGDEEALQKSDNPFDLAHYAGMQAWKQRGSDIRRLDYMKLLLAELDKRGWSHEEKMALLWFIEGVMHIEDDSAWNDGGQVHAAYPLRFAARTRAIDSAKPPACFPPDKRKKLPFGRLLMGRRTGKEKGGWRYVRKPDGKKGYKKRR